MCDIFAIPIGKPLWSLITTVACRCSLPVKVTWKVAFNPADLPGWKTCGMPFRKTSMVFGRRLLPTCLIFLWGNRLATCSSASEFLVT